MLKKYQIDAITSKILKKLNEKLEILQKQLRASWKPTKVQQECLDEMDELMEITDKMSSLRARANKIKESINCKTIEEVGTTFYYYNELSPSVVKNNRESFINAIINKKLKKIPNYQDIADSVTVATISTGFDIEAWINNFVEGINLCEE